MIEEVFLDSVIDTFIVPQRDKPKVFDGDIPWCRIEDFNGIYLSKSKSGLAVSRELVESMPLRVYPKGTVLVSCSADLGKCAIVSTPLITNQTFIGLVPSNKLDSHYLYYLMGSKANQLNNMAAGATIKYLSKKKFQKLKVYIPSLEAQKQIATILKNADALRDKTVELLKDYDLLSQSIFLEMFGDPGVNKKKWKIEEFGSHINVLTDYHANGSYQTLSKNVELTNDKDYALMVRTTDLENNNFEEGVNYISEKAYNFLTKSKVFGGEIIINKIGSAGKVYLMPHLDRPVSLGMNAFMLRLNNSLSTLFTYFYLKTKYGEWQISKRVKGAVTKTIRKDAVRAIPVMIPPIELQNQFVEKIALIEKQKDLAKLELKESEDLFNCLLQKAFKGELVS